MAVSTDRHRFARRARELNERAKLVEDLGRMPDRATEKDFRSAAELMRNAANDLEELVKAAPPGCICRRVEHDERGSWLDYAEDCIHHRQYHFLREKLKADYAKMEKALKDEVRMKLIAAAITGSACGPALQDEHLAENAVKIADDVILLLAETAK